MTVTNPGITSPCLFASSRGATEITFENQLTNDKTGLTIPSELTVSTLARPVVSQEIHTGPGIPALPGGTTVQRTPFPVVEVSNAVYASPTAATGTPIGFTMPALTAGQYLLQIPTAPSIRAAVLTVVATPAVPTSPKPLVFPTVPALSVPGATVVADTAQISRQLTASFRAWDQIGGPCLAAIIGRDTRVAEVRATGTSWAVARFRLIGGCPGVSRSGSTSSDTGVFEMRSGKGWSMNDLAVSPFPCPGAEGDVPGFGGSGLPASVVSAWHMRFAPNCAFPVYLQEPEVEQ